ncbi:MAG: class II fructose-bisphosphate aldolase family protein [Holosporales bacterium]|nr:class II fructose-bisphosphate aldolase family protein [Holosporales bacterium]
MGIGLVAGNRGVILRVNECYAVCAFNFSNLETLRAIFLAASDAFVPVILQVTESALNFMGLDYVLSMVGVSSKEFPDLQFSLHLDHGKDFNICKKCIDAGFSSVMIDKSSCGFEENVAATREVVDYANKFGVSVEGELGVLSGIEDDISVSAPGSFLTDPSFAARYIEETGVDSLAIAIGTVHGPYKGNNTPPKLDIPRLIEIKRQVGKDFPLVLHGASSVYPDLVSMCNQYGADIHGAYGISDSDLQSAVKCGINKVNIDTDLRLAYIAGLRQSMSQDPSSVDIRKHLGAAIEMMKKIAIRKIKLITKLEEC